MYNIRLIVGNTFDLLMRNSNEQMKSAIKLQSANSLYSNNLHGVLLPLITEDIEAYLCGNCNTNAGITISRS